MPPTPEPKPTRVAVIAVPGVGDDGLGDTADNLANSLIREGYFDWAIEDTVTVTTQFSAPAAAVPTEGKDRFIPPPADRYSAPRRRLRQGAAPRPPGSRAQPDGEPALVVDIYEMNWADLSRFPSGLWKFLFALFGIVLQIGKAGIEAARHLGGRTEWGIASLRRGELPSRVGFARAACQAVSIWLSLVVVPVTALILVLAFLLWISTISPGGFVQVAILVAGAALIALTLALIGLGLQHSGIHPRALVWVLVTGGLALSIAVVVSALLDTASTPTFLANALLVLAAYPLRFVWLTALGLSALGILAAWLLLTKRSPERGDDGKSPEWRAGHISLLSVTVAPYALALVAGVLLASTSLVLAEALGPHTWNPHATTLRCLDSPSDWTVQKCLEGEDASSYRSALDEGTPVAGAEKTEPTPTGIADRAEAGPQNWIKRIFMQILEPVALSSLVLLLGLSPCLPAKYSCESSSRSATPSACFAERPAWSGSSLAHACSRWPVRPPT